EPAGRFDRPGQAGVAEAGGVGDVADALADGRGELLLGAGQDRDVCDREDHRGIFARVETPRSGHSCGMEHFDIATVAERSGDFRRVVWTGTPTQLVSRTIPQAGHTGAEVH